MHTRQCSHTVALRVCWSLGAIKKQEFIAAPHLFQGASEGPEGIHIEQNVKETTVHEHVGDNLPPLEIRVLGIIEREPREHLVAVDLCCYKNQHVDNQQMLYRIGKFSHLNKLFIDIVFRDGNVHGFVKGTRKTLLAGKQVVDQGKLGLCIQNLTGFYG